MRGVKTESKRRGGPIIPLEKQLGQCRSNTMSRIFGEGGEGTSKRHLIPTRPAKRGHTGPAPRFFGVRAEAKIVRERG